MAVYETLQSEPVVGVLGIVQQLSALAPPAVAVDQLVERVAVEQGHEVKCHREDQVELVGGVARGEHVELESAVVDDVADVVLDGDDQEVPEEGAEPDLLVHEVEPEPVLFELLERLLQQVQQQDEQAPLGKVVGVDVLDGPEHEHLLGSPVVEHVQVSVELVAGGERGDVGQEVVGEGWFDFEFVEDV